MRHWNCFFRYLPISFLTLFILPIHSQIVITSDEYDTTNGTNFYWYILEDSSGGIPVNVGQPGGPHQWSFSESQFGGGDVEMFTILNPANTPFGSAFPEADHSWHFYSDEDTTDAYIYFNLTDSALYTLGQGFSIPDTEIVWQFTPWERNVTFPATIGTTWQNQYSFTFSLPNFIEYVNIFSSQDSIDAWGTADLPEGTFDCLRVYEHRTEIEEMYVGGVLIYSDTTRQILYTWITENIGFLAEIASLNGETDPNFTLAQEVTFRTTPTAITEPPPPISQEFMLEQNYPNPFNPVTSIRYSVGRAQGSGSNNAIVTLKVFDLLGREVKTLVNDRKAPGMHTVQWDGTDDNGRPVPSGVYFYRLMVSGSPETVFTRKMVLLR